MFSSLTAEEIDLALDEVAQEALDAAAIDRAPVDAFRLAEALGIVVAWDEAQQVRARYVRLASAWNSQPRPTVLLRPDDRMERRHWALAHEIGEHLAWQVFARLGSDLMDAGRAAREMIANQLAGRLLVPGAWLRRDAAECDWDLAELKTRYCTASHEVLARRMLDAGPPAIITIFDQGEIYWRRSNLPGRVPPPGKSELDCWRRCHEANRPIELKQSELRVRVWPVHEEHWRREIVRTEISTIELW